MNWQSYWTSYPKQFGKAEYLRQVKNTVGGVPVPDSQIAESVAAICSLLDLNSDDVLLDLCCGNGLLTKDFAQRCARVAGVDFSETLIEIARQSHAADNITYVRLNALELPKLRATISEEFSKITMHASLQYLAWRDFPALLQSMASVLSADGVILLAAIPDRQYKKTFYNTWSRRLHHIWVRATGRDQMGTWYDANMMDGICRRFGFDPVITPSRVWTYRFDLRLTRKAT